MVLSNDKERPSFTISNLTTPAPNDVASFRGNCIIETGTTTSPTAPTTIRRSLHGVLLSTENDGEKTTSGHDALGRVVATSRQMGADAPVVPVQSFNYAPCGDLIASTTYTNGTDAVTETYDYDMLGNRVATTDALGGTIYKAYDPFGRVVAEWGATYPVRHAYDTHGRRTSLSTTRDGAIWDTTTWAYDHATGLCTNKTYADGTTVAYTYTPDGKPLRTTYASGRWKENTYDANRRLISSRSAGGSGGAGGPPAETNDVSFAYDVFGQRIAESNAVASTTYQRDAHGNCTNETTILGGPPSQAAATTNTIERAYDSYGRLTQASLCASAPPREISYSSDGLIAAISNAEAVVEYSYTSDRLDAGYTLTLTNGTTFTRTVVRDAYRRNLVLAITNSVNGVVIETLEYAYDALGRPVSRNADAFGYNSRSELTAAAIGPNLYGYDYDSIGNRLSAAANAATNSYSANCLNQYTSISNLCASVPLCEPSYDADGNMTGDGTFAYAYDAENRLVSVTSAAETNGAIRVLNAYDHRNRRIRKTAQRLNSSIAPPPSPPVGIHEWETQETHTFVWDGNNIVLEKVEFADGTTRTFEYFWGADKSGSEQGAGGVEGLLAVSMDGVFYIPCYDHNGNIILYVSETGSIAAQYVYDPYGNVVESYGDLAGVFHFGFSTQYYDRETGMVGYKRRFYRPDLGRWLNRDPIEEEGGENLYAFCRNNAIIYYDPNGESFEDVSNFCAGVGDSLSFGITQLFRRGLNRMIEGTWDDPADVESSAYTAGEVTEVTVEIAVTLGGATLRHTAKAVSRRAVEGSARSAYRRVHNLVGRGGEVHHINPIKGHPNGSKARYPLPYEWAARSEWNLTWYATRAEHQAAHAQMQLFETIDKYRESTMITRQAVNMMINYLNTSSETKCWDSLDVQTSIFYMEYESYGTNLNAVPESVSIQVQ